LVKEFQQKRRDKNTNMDLKKKYCNDMKWIEQSHNMVLDMFYCDYDKEGTSWFVEYLKTLKEYTVLRRTLSKQNLQKCWKWVCVKISMYS
jgi:hypothetical protein